MKKYLILLLASLLLLTGCAAQDMTQTSADTAATTTEVNDPGLYVPGSSVEQQTGGAIRRYDLDGDSYSWFSAIGDKLLLASCDGRAELMLLTGAECVPAVTQIKDSDLSNSQVTYGGLVYYAAEENVAVFLDPQLRQINRVQLPEDIQGQPAFSSDGGEIFYCTGQQIRALETERGISRMVKTHNCASQTLLGCYFEGRLLACRVEDAQGNVNIIYVSTETGQTMHTENGISDLYTYDDSYFAVRMDGTTQQYIYGTLDGAVGQLNVDATAVVGVLELGGAVSYTMEENGSMLLGFYELASGVKTAALKLEGFAEPQAFLGDKWSGCLWILTEDLTTGGKVLLRWDPKVSAIEDETVYTSGLYTAQSPDEEGLRACENRVDTLNSTYGVRIRIWQTAVKYPGAYALEPEYQTAAVDRCLDALEPVLGEFPKKFLDKSVASTVRICIVRSVDEQVRSVQYWDDGDAFIILSVGVDVRSAIMQGLGYIVDSHILGNSAKYDYWDGQNPEGFVYGAEDQDAAYLAGETRAFVDEVSMTSPVEDRSRIFWQAMLADNGEIFQSEIMQSKLRYLCQAIRDAWNLERKEETYPWEQYLKEPIAHKAT